MWGSVTRDEQKQLANAEIRTYRDELYDEVRTYQKELRESYSEQQAIREQIKLSKLRSFELQKAISEGRTSGQEGHKALTAENRNRGVLESREQYQKLRAQKAQQGLEETRFDKNALPANQQKGGNAKSKARNLWNAPNKLARGGGATLLLGLIGIIVVLFLALVPANKNGESRIMLAQKALAGKASIA